jgi:hypothetical protein
MIGREHLREGGMTNIGLTMPDLLERSGFCLRGKNRADCAHCQGRSIATVSYTDDVAHCFRCQWKANTVTLAKELAIQADPKTRQRWQHEMQARFCHRNLIERFESWRNFHIRRLSNRYRELRFQAQLAGDVLRRYPDCDPAWDALARFCHEEGELIRQLDFLTCAKASSWLEADAKILDVFDAWRKIHAKR